MPNPRKIETNRKVFFKDHVFLHLPASSRNNPQLAVSGSADCLANN